ncbi:ROK family protein [Streptomyces sp. NPDC020412]|uniref:ROK family protein n=1 Tax=Streptomyces sp. NPDC020412 TaxID=3365073 RepID=UPI0037A08E3B
MTHPTPVVALDVGGTKLAVRADVDGACVHERTLPWPRDGGVDDDLVLLERAVREAIAALDPALPAGRSGPSAAEGDTWAPRPGPGRRRTPAVRVGIAAAPNVGADGVVVAWPNRPGWVGRALGAVVARGAGVDPADVLFGDDATLAALAEAASFGGRDLVYLGVGTGVGGGLVCGGRLLTGAWGTAGELGHLQVDPAGPRCRCGAHGCLQAVVSGPALAAYASDLRGSPVTTYDLVAAAARSAPWAESTLDHAADRIARALSLLVEVVQPAEVRIGGGLGAALPALPGRVARRLAVAVRAGRPLPEVLPAGHGAHSSLAGAALLAAHGPRWALGEGR